MQNAAIPKTILRSPKASGRVMENVSLPRRFHRRGSERTTSRRTTGSKHKSALGILKKSTPDKMAPAISEEPCFFTFQIDRAYGIATAAEPIATSKSTEMRIRKRENDCEIKAISRRVARIVRRLVSNDTAATSKRHKVKGPDPGLSKITSYAISELTGSRLIATAHQ